MQRRSSRSVVWSGMVWLSCYGFNVNAQTPATDLYSLVLIAADLDDASKTLSLRDLNDDGVLDQQEWKTLQWADTAKRVDLSRDGKLAHLEIAIHFASQRKQNDVQEIDRPVCNTRARRFQNSDGEAGVVRCSSALLGYRHRLPLELTQCQSLGAATG